MIEQESQATVGYGAMLLESFVGVMALIAASVLIPGDYLAINTMLSPDALAAMGFPVSRIQELSRLVEVDVAGRPGGAVSLAVGMASIFSALPGMAGLMAYWYQFALVFEALFILTTIDTGTRVGRYLIQEMGGRLYASVAADELVARRSWSAAGWSWGLGLSRSAPAAFRRFGRCSAQRISCSAPWHSVSARRC